MWEAYFRTLLVRLLHNVYVTLQAFLRWFVVLHSLRIIVHHEKSFQILHANRDYCSLLFDASEG